MEEWKDIPGYEGLYQVSNLGNVKSMNYHREGKPKVMKPFNCQGYKLVRLCKEGEFKPYRVHRLVAMTFIPNPNNYKEVNHKDENKSNNRVDNLEWCTSKYNANYGTRSERQSKAMKNKNSKKIKCVETGQIFDSKAEANEHLGKRRGNANISMCLTGKNETAYGYHWEYIQD